MKKRSERGAIVVEATISLTAFVFLMFTILSLVNIVYVQARMGVALHSAAKEISQYSYLYYALGVDGYDQKAAAGTGDAKATATETIKGIDKLVTSFSKAGDAVGSGDLSGAYENVSNGVSTAEDLASMYKEQIGDDPKAFILGMGKMALNEVKEEGKSLLAKTLAKAFMGKNLKATKSDSADRFLKQYRVVGGMSGLNFNGTSYLVNGESDRITLCVTYDVSVMKLLNIDFKFKFCQVAITKAWDNGICQLADAKSEPQKGPSVWDKTNNLERDNEIKNSERKNYQYTVNNKKFEAYDSSKNEFVVISTVNPNDATYQDADRLCREKLEKKYDEMETQVSQLSRNNKLKMKDKNGNEELINSDESTRKYKVVLVVPDNADMSIVNSAVQKFKSEHPGVTVEINTKYGSYNKTEDKADDKG